MPPNRTTRETLGYFSRARGAKGMPQRVLQDELVLDHLDIARAVAGRFSGRGRDLEDLRQVAYLGLIKAVRGFNPEFGIDFRAYAAPTIAGELKRYLRDSSLDAPDPAADGRLLAETIAAKKRRPGPARKAGLAAWCAAGTGTSGAGPAPPAVLQGTDTGSDRTTAGHDADAGVQEALPCPRQTAALAAGPAGGSRSGRGTTGALPTFWGAADAAIRPLGQPAGTTTRRRGPEPPRGRPGRKRPAAPDRGCWKRRRHCAGPLSSAL